ncbi:MAG: hypothetical protein HY303_18420 [Candidatus Wallbacteria bacterium]|nr:hypothetical protein [Candidatus Wallbacteria bacterium]
MLELKGAVLIRKMDPTGVAKDISYRGRGILIALTEKEDEPATLDATVHPVTAGPANELVLAHRVSRDLVAAGKLPALKLGPSFEGCVYSDTGVKPTGTATKIVGNLVTGLLNKAAIPDSATGPTDGVKVQYRETLKDVAKGSRVPYWTVEQSGEVMSVEPGS